MTIKRLLLALVGMFSGWLAVLVMVGLFSDAAPAYVVPLPPQAWDDWLAGTVQQAQALFKLPEAEEFLAENP